MTLKKDAGISEKKRPAFFKNAGVCTGKGRRSSAASGQSGKGAGKQKFETLIT